MKILAVIWLAAVLLTFSGCSAETTDETTAETTGETVISDIGGDADVSDFTPITEPETVPETDAPEIPVYRLSDEEYAVYMDFASELFRGCALSESREPGTNMMISPLSVTAALGLTGNGACGSTLAEMENAAGLDRDGLNGLMSAYLTSLPRGEGYGLTAANSVWHRDTDALDVKAEFIAAAEDFYDAEVHKSPFDASACDAINGWVSENTDGMIDQLIDPAEGIPADAMLYLINALAFDSLWNEEYRDHMVWEEDFTAESGEVRKTEMMHSRESSYLRAEDSVGFLKFYKDKKYAFVGLLPDEGIALSDYIASLTGEKLASVLGTLYGDEVDAALPKFESEYGLTMNDQLRGMGIADLFDEHACDLTDMAEYHDGDVNLYVSRVMHRTFISVDEKGTRAAAVTGVEVVTEEAVSEPIRIHLNRPFVYMIVEWENRVPVFMGTFEAIG